MAEFMITLYEIAAHTFTVDTLTEAGAVELARAKFDAQLDADSCVSVGLDRRRAPLVAPLSCDLMADRSESTALNLVAMSEIGPGRHMPTVSMR